MGVMNKETAFLTPSLMVLFVYLFILTVVVAVLTPQFTTRSEYDTSARNDTKAVTRTLRGYLTKLEEHVCYVPVTGDYCSSGQKNDTTIKYPSTIVVVQSSLCCPFVLVGVICLYWEERRHKHIPTKTAYFVVICIFFEILHTLGYIFFPVYIGPEVGFTWKNLDMGFYIGLVNNVFVWIYLALKIYANKRTHLKRKYRTRRRESDPVYIVNKFIFVEQNHNKRTAALFTLGDGERNRDMKSDRVNVLGCHGDNNSVDISSSAGGVVNTGFNTEQSQNTKQVVCTFTNESEANTAEEQIPTHATAGNEPLELNIGIEEEENNNNSFISSLIEKLWSPQLIGIGRDSHVPRYTRINIRKICHVHNENVWNLYMKKKKEILNYVEDYLTCKLFCPEEFGTDIKPVKTDELFEQVAENNSAHKLDKNLNEHYLFHGTDISNIPSIIEKGFDKSACQRTMLGKGIYFTDHPVKADQYTGARGRHGDQTGCCMILARVLLGNCVITKVRTSRLMSAKSTPCKVCLTVNCTHDSSYKFDSFIFDGGLFREYVVYENWLAYPEYVVYYDRVA